MISMRESSRLYYQDLRSRAQDQTAIIMIFFFVSLGILILSIILLCPVVSSVNKTRMNVLSLFVDIPNYHIINLSIRCEKFLGTMLEDQHDEVDSDDGSDTAKADEI